LQVDLLNASAKSPDNEVVVHGSTPEVLDQYGKLATVTVEAEPSTGVSKDESLSKSNGSQGASSIVEDVGSNCIPSQVLEDEDFGEFVTSVQEKESSGNIVYARLIDRWIRRQEIILCSVLAHHLDQKDFIVCLAQLEDLVRKRPQDVVVLSKYGYIQLQLGDLYGARRTFSKIEAVYEQQGRSSSQFLASLLSRNRGLLYFSLKQYSKAVKEFDVVLELDPGDIVSANNKV
jgi:hypothetical protein